MLTPLGASANIIAAWRHRLARPRTPDSHSGNRGSNPLGATTLDYQNAPSGEEAFLFEPSSYRNPALAAEGWCPLAVCLPLDRQLVAT